MRHLPKYTGNFCEKCETCQTQCEQMRPCVECLAFGSPDRLDIDIDNTTTQNEIRESCQAICPFNYDELVPYRYSSM